MAEIEMYGYVTNERSPECQVPTGSHDFRAPIIGFELNHDDSSDSGLYVLSFVMKSENGKMVVRAATLRMTKKDLQKLRKAIS